MRAQPSRPRWAPVPAAAGMVAVIAALLTLAPLASLIVIALADTGELWTHLARYVIPVALAQTALLLAGVAAVTIVAGVGTAWTVTTFDFPARAPLTWLLPLPLAIPTYIVAYVYVDILDALGPVQSALRTLFGWSSAADHWFPDVRSLGGAVCRLRLRALSLCLLSPRARCSRRRARYSRSQPACWERGRCSWRDASPCHWRGPPSPLASRSRCSRRSTTSVPANISASRP